MTTQAIASVRVYPGREADFRLYDDDDGETNAYLKGAGRSARLHWTDRTGRLTVTGDKGLGAGLEQRVSVVGR